MSKKVFFLFIITILTTFNLFSNFLIDEEFFYNGDKSVIQGKKRYIYDDKNNIISVVSYNNENIEEARTNYVYEDTFLVTAIEYNGKTKIKTIEFLYSSQKLEKKIEFDIQGKILLVHNYIYSGDGNLKGLEDFSETNQLIGKREFLYQNNLLDEEIIYDEKNSIIMTKKYLYNDNILTSIAFYFGNKRLIRVIEKRYTKIKRELNKFGYVDNFWDIR